MNNKLIFGQYYDTDSVIHKLDPRVKIIGVLLLFISLFFINNIFVLSGLTLLLLILIIITKTPIHKFFKSISTMSFIMIFTFIMQILTYQNDASYICTLDFNLTVLNLIVIVISLVLWIMFSKYIKYFKTTLFIVLLLALFLLQYYVNITPLIIPYSITLTKIGILEGAFFVVRLIDFLFLSSLLTLTTKPTQINCGLDKLLKPLAKTGLNTGAFAMIISVTLRFIPTLIAEAGKILKAQASRGADFDDVNLMTKVFQAVSLVIPLFVITYKKSVDLTYAMEARGYVERKERSSLYELKYNAIDYASLCFIWILFIGSIVSVFIL